MGFSSFNIFISFVGYLDYHLYFVIFRTNYTEVTDHVDNLVQSAASRNYHGYLVGKCIGQGTFSLLFLIAAKIQYYVLNIYSVRKITRKLTTLVFYNMELKPHLRKHFFSPYKI